MQKGFPIHRHNQLKKYWNKQVCKNSQKLGDILLKRNDNGQKSRKHNIGGKFKNLVYMKGNEETCFVIPCKACCKEEPNVFYLTRVQNRNVYL